MNAHSRSLTFSITGEAITNTLRGMVLDGRWRESVFEFKECIEGWDQKMIDDVLTGHMTFTGSTRDPEGIQLVEDNTEAGETYRRTYDYMFSGCVIINRRLYRPMIVVTDYGPSDRLLGLGLDPREDFVTERFHDKTHLIDKDSLLLRAKKYSNEKDVVTTFCAFRDRPSANGPRELAVIFEPAPDLPYWSKPHRTPQAAVDASLSRLRFTGHDREYGTMADWLKENVSAVKAANFKRQQAIVWEVGPDEEITPDYSNRIAEILKQNEEGGYGTRDVYFGDEFGVRIVPNGPLHKWALDRFNRYDSRRLSVPDWKPVNPSGMKLPMDDPAHTDWMMAAGLLDADYLTIGRYMDKLCSDVQHEVLGIKTQVLVGGRSTAVGAIKFCNKDTEVDEETIAVIPHAGEEFFEIARKAAGVIALRGGAMSHLAVHGLAEGFLIVRDEKAKSKFQEGQWVFIDATEGTLTIVADTKPTIPTPGA